MYLNMDICIHGYMHTYSYIYIYTCICMCIYIDMYTHVDMKMYNRPQCNYIRTTLQPMHMPYRYMEPLGSSVWSGQRALLTLIGQGLATSPDVAKDEAAHCSYILVCLPVYTHPKKTCVYTYTYHIYVHFLFIYIYIHIYIYICI